MCGNDVLIVDIQLQVRAMSVSIIGQRSVENGIAHINIGDTLADFA